MYVFSPQLEACHCVAESAATQVAWWMAPLLSAFLAVVGAVGGSWIAIAFDRRKAINQELVKKRLDLYSTYVPQANDIYCYLWRVGDFRSMTPKSILARKRILDRFIHVYGSLFEGDELARKYQVFIRACFSTFGGPGTAAAIRADPQDMAAQFGNRWNPAWDSYFKASDACDMEQLDAAYREFTSEFAAQVSVK